LFADTDVTYQQTPHGWLPLRWTGTIRRADGQSIAVTRLRVQQLEVDSPVSDADFQVDIRPGMRIIEETYNDPDTAQGKDEVRRVSYYVDSDGRWVPIGDNSGQGNEAGRRYWPYIAGAGVVLLAAAWVVLRWRRKRAGTAS
jgi:hypothetical protein